MSPDDQLALVLGKMQLNLLQADIRIQELTKENERLQKELADAHEGSTKSAG